MRRTIGSVLVAFLVAWLGAAGIQAMDAEEAAEKRAEIDRVAEETLKEVLEDNEGAKEAYDSAAGWAAFSNFKFAFIFSGGKGAGVAVNKDTGERTYMKMGTGGVGAVGAQKYQVLMLFEDKERFEDFITKGWKAEAGVHAAAGEKEASRGTTFVDGIAIYQISEKGLMAAAEVAGTKYKVDKALNKK